MVAARAAWFRRFGISAAVALMCGYVPYQLYATSGWVRFLKLRSERVQLHEQNLQLRQENLRLRAELDSLVDSRSAKAPLSRAAIERAARDELGLTRPGEIVFVFDSNHRIAPPLEATLPMATQAGPP